MRISDWSSDVCSSDLGRPIVIFPEGTRVAPHQHRPYQPGVAALYGQLGLPVVPVALNSGLFWRRRSFLKQPGTIILEFLPPIAPGLPRKVFLARLEQAIEGRTRLLAGAGPPELQAKAKPLAQQSVCRREEQREGKEVGR